MANFKIIATMTTTRILTKSVDAKSLEEATAKILLSAKPDDWKTSKKLSTISK